MVLLAFSRTPARRHHPRSEATRQWRISKAVREIAALSGPAKQTAAGLTADESAVLALLIGKMVQAQGAGYAGKNGGDR